MTVIECVSGDGVVIPPLIIWSAKTHQNAWYSIGLDLQIRFAISPNGYTDDELGLEWFEKCFNSNRQTQAGEKNKLFIMNSHGSHVTGRFLGFCLNNNILPFCLPAHITHVLQPLDVGCFDYVAHYYQRGVENLCRVGVKGIFKYQFVKVYMAARFQALCEKLSNQHSNKLVFFLSTLIESCDKSLEAPKLLPNSNTRTHRPILPVLLQIKSSLLVLPIKYNIPLLGWKKTLCFLS